MTNILELLKNEKVEWKKLGEVCEFNRGKTITKKSAIEGEIPVIGGGQKPAYYHNESNREGVTITVAGSGAYAGFVSYWEQPIFLSDAFSIEPNQKLNKRYLFHWLLQNQSRIYELKQGSGVPHVYGSDLAKFEIPIPSIETQEKIVEILDKLTNYVTELQSELQSRTKQYTYYRDKLLSEEYLNKITQNKINNFSLKSVAEYSSKRISAEELDIFNYVGVDNLLKDKYGREDSSYVPETGTSTRFEKGDILIGNIRPYLRKIWHADRIGGTNGDVLAVSVKSEDIIDSRYLYHVLADEKFFDYNIKYSKGAKMPRGDKNKIMEYHFPIPPLHVQQHVVSILDKFDTLVNDIKEGLPKEIEQRQKQYEYWRSVLLTFK